MIRFEPFAALRYAPGTDLDAVIAPPYDVLLDADVDALEARSPRNIVHVDVPRGGDDRYEKAAATLAEWVAEGVMVRDDEPSFTLYRMRFTDETGAARDLVGVLGALEVVDEGAGGVLPHERTTKKASTDRLDLTRATRANLSPVWGLSLAKGLTELLREPGEPLGSMTVEGVEHVIERVTDAGRVAAIRDLVGSDDVLIADGHHRYGVARKYRDEQRDAGENGVGEGSELTLTFVGEMVEEQLSIAAIHRLYHGISHADLRAALERRFEISAAPAPSAEVLRQMEAEGRLALIAPDGSCEWLTPRPGAFDGVRSLDGAWLEDALADVEHDVTYQHGVTEVVGVLAAGDAEAAVLIRPVGIAEIERTAREGLLMPPKSTFFTPKLRTGFVVRPL
ncbi:MAG: DUF1015 domain-containing protein [Dermatophilus congolensis]|nr:DUF1015 domain-containing protein [Dermatophilus congolensis]